MEGPRSPAENELSSVLDFLNKKLRAESAWSIDNEYPTALTSSNLHNMRIIKNESQIVSHAVVKPLIIKSPYAIFKAGAIGSVVTDPDHRNQGHSKLLLNDCINLARSQQCDIAILWTNLHDFYRKLGFELAGTEISLLIDKPLADCQTDLRFSSDPKVAPDAIFRLYSNHTVASVRTIEETRKYMNIPQTKIYTAWEKNGTLAAYAIEGKGADLGGYIHEWGGHVSKLLPLINYIQVQKKGPLTMIVPRHAQNLITQALQKGAVANEGFLGMIKIINPDLLFGKIKRAFRAEGVSDIMMEVRDGQFIFGVGQDLFTLTNEADVTSLLFGPIDLQRLDIMSEKTRTQLSKILPLPFWIWGWDSV
jgi:N-acetylglutamate synthase-like GNAT family acetyltransferase